MGKKKYTKGRVENTIHNTSDKLTLPAPSPKMARRKAYIYYTIKVWKKGYKSGKKKIFFSWRFCVFCSKFFLTC